MNMAKMVAVASSVALLGSGCGGEPTDDLEPVAGFDLNRYLGTWYEIARLPNSFQEGLTNVTADYSLRSDGKVRVLNQGLNEAEGAWEEAEGRAKFQGDSDVALLKVTFVGGFFLFGGDYKVIRLDPNYQHALVTSSTRDYLWFLSRQPTVDQELIDEYIDLAEQWEFDVDNWLFTDQALNAESN